MIALAGEGRGCARKPCIIRIANRELMDKRSHRRRNELTIHAAAQTSAAQRVEYTLGVFEWKFMSITSPDFHYYPL
jgi:hypothetical protein